jgi:hypothetical protein
MAIVGVVILPLLRRPGDVAVGFAVELVEPLAKPRLVSADKGVDVVAGR